MTTMKIYPHGPRKGIRAIRVSPNGDIYFNSVLGADVRKGVRYKLQLLMDGDTKVKIIPSEEGFLPSGPGTTTALLMRCRPFSEALGNQLPWFPWNVQIPVELDGDGVITLDSGSVVDAVLEKDA